MAGLQSGEGRKTIDSVVWAQYIHVTDTQTATSPLQMLPQCIVLYSKNYAQQRTISCTDVMNRDEGTAYQLSHI